MEQAIGEQLFQPELLLAMGRLLMAQERYGEATQVLSAALIRDPRNEEILYNIGIAMSSDGHHELAFTYLREVVGDGPAYHDLGVICQRLGDLPNAERYFARAVDFDPTLANSQRELTEIRQRLRSKPEPMHVSPLTDQQLLTLLKEGLGPIRSVRPAPDVTILPAERQLPDEASGGVQHAFTPQQEKPAVPNILPSEPVRVRRAETWRRE